MVPTSVIWGRTVGLSIALVPHGSTSIALSVVVTKVIGTLTPVVWSTTVTVCLGVPILIGLVVPSLVVGRSALPWPLVAIPTLVAITTRATLVGGAIVALIAPSTTVI